MESDFSLLTRNPADNQAKMQTAFKAAMSKLATVGQDRSQMVDCSDVIPVPQPFTGQAFFPPSLTHNDIEQAVCVSIENILNPTKELFKVCNCSFPCPVYPSRTS